MNHADTNPKKSVGVISTSDKVDFSKILPEIKRVTS